LHIKYYFQSQFAVVAVADPVTYNPAVAKFAPVGSGASKTIDDYNGIESR
jgi:hypothetical protein